MSRWITLEQASEELGVSVRTCQRYIKQGKLKARRVRGKKKISDKELNEFIGLSATETTENATETRQSATKKTTETTAEPESVAPNLAIPEGYKLVPAETLEVLQSQVKELTQSVKTMQTTQELLIKRGLGLTQLNKPSATNTTKTTKPVATKQAKRVVIDAEVVATKDKKRRDKKTTSVATKRDKPKPESIKGKAEKEPETKTIWQMIGEFLRKKRPAPRKLSKVK
jgi:excisionase family DNA binding protein